MFFFRNKTSLCCAIFQQQYYNCINIIIIYNILSLKQLKVLYINLSELFVKTRLISCVMYILKPIDALANMYYFHIGNNASLTYYFS